VLAADFPDPAVLRAPDGYFYAYATQTSTPTGWLNVQVARSRDLVAWERLGDALPQKPVWASGKQQFWAPHALYDRGERRFFLYYSAEPDDGEGKCIGVATAPTPAGPFVDSGAPLVCGEGIENIDPMAFDDPKTGKRLLYWGSGGQPIRVRELAADRTRFADDAEKPVLFPDDGARYGSLIEGAWIIHRDGAYYLFFSGDRCCSRVPRYAIMVARSSSPFGPFEKFHEPVLEKSEAWIAPGHCAVIRDDAGGDWLVYHAMESRRFATDGARLEPFVPRLLLIDPLVYVDGWPRTPGNAASAERRGAPAISVP
jgi:arabinan endo-1,5-alpha-L-arabinosidase